MPEDDIKLIEYSLGLLEPKKQHEVEQTIQSNPELCKSFESVHELLAKIALSVPPLEPSERLREQILAATKKESRFEGFIKRLSSFLDLTAERVRELLTTVDNVPDSPWKESGLPGVRVQRFMPGPRLARTVCQIMSMDPGALLPVHRHLGDEWGFVLQGSALEDETRVFAPGDIVYKPVDTTHALRAIDDESLVIILILHKGIEWLSKEE